MKICCSFCFARGVLLSVCADYLQSGKWLNDGQAEEREVEKRLKQASKLSCNTPVPVMYRYLTTKGLAETTQRIKCRQTCRHFLPTVPTLPTLSMPTLPTVPTLPTCQQKCRHLVCRHLVCRHLSRCRHFLKLTCCRQLLR